MITSSCNVLNDYLKSHNKIATKMPSTENGTLDFKISPGGAHPIQTHSRINKNANFIFELVQGEIASDPSVIDFCTPLD